MEGVPPDLEPDVIMKKKGKSVVVRNKLKSDSGNVPVASSDLLKAKSVSVLVNKFESETILTESNDLGDAIIRDSSKSELNSLDSSINDGSVMKSIEIKGMDAGIVGSAIGSSSVNVGSSIELKLSSNSVIANVAGASMVSPDMSIPITKVEGVVSSLSPAVIEFENDIMKFCKPGEKIPMMVFWNSLTNHEKEGFVHGLRFTKKKYNSGNESDYSAEDSIDNIKKLSSVSQRNDLLLNWKDLSPEKKEKVFHKLCTSKIKKKVEANFGKNRIPFNSSSSLLPNPIVMKRSSEVEASVGLKKVGETVVSLLPEGVPVSDDNDPIVVELGKICAMQPVAKEKKGKGLIEIDEMVSKQLEEVCNNIVYNFPSKFSHLDILNEGEFKFNYVEEDLGSKEEKMAVDDIMKQNENARNKNGGLLITEGMLEKVNSGSSQEKTELPLPISKEVEDKVGEKVSYAEKVSGKKLNAANLISVIKKGS